MKKPSKVSKMLMREHNKRIYDIIALAFNSFIVHGEEKKLVKRAEHILQALLAVDAFMDEE